MRYSLWFLMLLVAVFIHCTPKQKDKMSTGRSGMEKFRQNPPAAGPAPVVELGKYETFQMKNGMRVIVVENNKLPRVSFQLLLDIPPMNQGEYAGMYDLAGEMITKGTAKKSKTELDEAVDFIGATLNSSANGIFGSALKKHSDQLLELMSEVLMQPSFPEEEFQKLKVRVISGITASKDDPNVIAENVAKVLRYGKEHPYGEISTVESVQRVELQQCKEYFNQYFAPDIAYLAIVGDITADEARNLTEKYFGGWEKRPLSIQNPRMPRFASATTVHFVNKPGAVQSVVNITYPVELKHNSPDRMAATLMNTLLGGFFSSRVNMNLREDKGFTYGAFSSLSPDQYVASFRTGGSFGTSVTDSAVAELLVEMRRLRDEMISDEELKLVKSYSAGTFARSLERPQTIANFALAIARYGLPDDYYETYLQRLEAVTKEDIRSAAIKYLQPDKAHILVVGNQKELSDKLTRFDHNGEIRFYDTDGNLIQQTETPVIPADITAEEVLMRYIKAIGGEENIDNIRTIHHVSNASTGGMMLIDEVMYKLPGKMKQEMRSQGNIMQSTIVNGDRAQVMQMGQVQMLEGEHARSLIEFADPFPERKLLLQQEKISLSGIEIVDGLPCYRIEVITDDPAPRVMFFETETGYKRRVITTIAMGDQITEQYIDYQEYSSIEGVYFPFVRRLGGPAMPVQLIFRVQTLLVNEVFMDEDFDFR